MNKKILWIITVIIILISAGVYFVLNQQQSSPSQMITNFEECARAGYPVGESYPRQCWTPDGGHFVEEIEIEQIKEKYTSELMAIPGVVGVGIGECEGNPCIKVFLENDSSDLKAKIPAQLDGFKVDIEVTGPIEALGQVTIVSMAPLSGSLGEGVTIYGSGFTPNNNDIAFTSDKIKFRGRNTAYLNGIVSPDGKTLRFNLPDNNNVLLGACAFSQMKANEACPDIGIELPTGSVQISVVNKNGTSNSVTIVVR